MAPAPQAQQSSAEGSAPQAHQELPEPQAHQSSAECPASEAQQSSAEHPTSEVQQSPPERPAQATSFACHRCPGVFLTRKDIYRHTRWEHVGTQCVWPGCNVQTESTEDQRAHITAAHIVKTIVPLTINGGYLRKGRRCSWPSCGTVVTSTNIRRHCFEHSYTENERRLNGIAPSQGLVEAQNSGQDDKNDHPVEDGPVEDDPVKDDPEPGEDHSQHTDSTDREGEPQMPTVAELVQNIEASQATNRKLRKANRKLRKANRKLNKLRKENKKIIRMVNSLDGLTFRIFERIEEMEARVLDI
ncbi:hypothetical protein F4818DRAFT_443834 [Hypoxylon cercidicola]|nr:hypothetical protein F4818DRAFT_443834 [Hypoxylon cercidicola]